MLCSLLRSSLVHTVYHCDSEGWFSCDQVIFLTCVFFGKNNAAFKWKDATSGFLVSPGSAEVLVKWSGKIKCFLIVYFLSNSCAKNYQNRFMYVRVIARQSSDSFLGTQCTATVLPSILAATHVWTVTKSLWHIVHCNYEKKLAASNFLIVLN